MFRRRLNELRLTLRLEPLGPLLVKSGADPADYVSDVSQTSGAQESPADVSFDALYEQIKQDIEARTERERERRERQKQEIAQETGDPEALRRKLDLDMRFVTTYRNGAEQPYLPGSSLKGVLRTRCEQLARTFLPEDMQVCDILDAASSCAAELQERDAGERYAAACPICQVFGCGALASRLAVSDGYLREEPAQVDGVRSGVGINRQRGAAQSGALFFYEVLERGAFEFTLTLENFELWQVGLVGLALHDLWTGSLPVGYGTRRGLGRVRGHVQSAKLTYFGKQSYAQDGGCLLKGIAALLPEDDASELHGLRPENTQPILLRGAKLSKQGLRQQWSIPAAAQETLWETGGAAWQALFAS